MSIRVLIVEDNEVFRHPLQRGLEVAGFSVSAVGSGEQALQILARSPVDLLLTDQRLPGMDGLQLLTRTKASDPRLPVIVMTAFGTVESADDARRRGAHDYLVKPFDMPELLATVNRALAREESPRWSASSGPA